MEASNAGNLAEALVQRCTDAAAAAPMNQPQIQSIREQGIVQRQFSAGKRLLHGESMEVHLDGWAGGSIGLGRAAGNALAQTPHAGPSGGIERRHIAFSELERATLHINQQAALVPQLADHAFAEGRLYGVAARQVRRHGSSVQHATT